MFNWAFWNDALTRCVRTFAQTLIAALGGGALNIWSVGWHSAIGVALGSAFISLLMSVDRSGQPSTTTVVEPVIVEPQQPAFVTPMKMGAGCGDSLR